MHKQLELLIMLHDLDILLNEVNQDKKAGFEINKRMEDLVKAKRKIEGKLQPNFLKRYQKLAEKYARAVVPVIDGICYGCFVTLPTSFVVRKNRNEGVDFCPYCARFIYWFDD